MNKNHKTLICFGAAVLCLAVSMFSRLLLTPLIALAAYMAVEWGLVYLFPPLVGLTVGIFAAFGFDSSSLPILVSFILAAVMLTVYGKKRLPHRYCVLGLAVILCLGSYLSLTLGSMLAGEPPHTEAAKIWESVWDSAIPASLSSGSAAEEISDIGASVALMLPDLLMLASVMLGEALALGLVLLYRLCHKVFKTVPAPMARFSAWRLPSGSIVGGLILLSAIGLAFLLKLDGAKAVAFALGFITASLFSVQGLAYFFFVFEMSKAPSSVRTVFCVFCALTFPYCMLFLAAIGVREQIQKRRRAVRLYLESIKNMSEFEKRSDELAKYGYIREDKPVSEQNGRGEAKPSEGDNDKGPQADK
ncbi:MAG: DUF2232 domain-containing protein [Clostridia bacterium]|nr:DUF2232 domain-containing protein [Clostridia bacterium]